MPLDPSAVGKTGETQRRSWTSKDSLLYAVGVGAGCEELAFTTENSKGIEQRVLPTQAVILGGGGLPMSEIGDFTSMLRFCIYELLCWTLRWSWCVTVF